jgi:hypothetical protein
MRRSIFRYYLYIKVAKKADDTREACIREKDFRHCFDIISEIKDGGSRTAWCHILGDWIKGGDVTAAQGF